MTGLGTHLTLDLEGRVRFGPDIEWIGQREEWREDMDFWEKHLGASEERKEQMFKAITSFVRFFSSSFLAVCRDFPDFRGFFF